MNNDEIYILRNDYWHCCYVFDLSKDIYRRKDEILIGACDKKLYDTKDSPDGYYEEVVKSFVDVIEFVEDYDRITTKDGKTVDMLDFLKKVCNKFDELQKETQMQTLKKDSLDKNKGEER